jgi:hypothetical protein
LAGQTYSVHAVGDWLAVDERDAEVSGWAGVEAFGRGGGPVGQALPVVQPREAGLIIVQLVLADLLADGFRHVGDGRRLCTEPICVGAVALSAVTARSPDQW